MSLVVEIFDARMLVDNVDEHVITTFMRRVDTQPIFACSKLRHWRRSGVFIVHAEHISHIVLVLLLLTLSM